MWQNPLRFHETSGDDVSITNNSTTAHRFDSTHTGIVFTSRPLVHNEKLSLKFTDILDKNKDLISIGFTSQPPDKNHRPTNSIKIHSLTKNLSIKHKILYFYVTQTGHIYFGIDDVDKGQIGSLQQTPNSLLWAFVHIHSAPNTIELVNSTPPRTNLELSPLNLHKTCGRQAKIANNVAFKFDKSLKSSYVFTERPIQSDEYVSIKIMEGINYGSGHFMLSFTNCNPSLLVQQELPDSLEALFKRNEFWIDVSDTSWMLKPDDTISFVVQKNGDVKIWRNKTSLLDVVRMGQPPPLWGVFGLDQVAGIKLMSSELQKSKPNISNKVVQEKRDDQEVSDCVVCCDDTADTALCPCGHLCLCGVCARKVWRGAGQGKCPICRTNIKNVLKIYKS